MFDGWRLEVTCCASLGNL